MQSIGKYLSQRYPQVENPWRIILPISIFIGLFLVIFQPFGLDDLQVGHKTIVLAGYGLVTFFILILDMVLIPLLFPSQFREEVWTTGKELVNLIWILFTVGLGNLLYSSVTLGFPLNLNYIVVFQAYTLVIGIIPITTLILIKQGYLRRKNETNAEAITSALVHNPVRDQKGNSVRFLGENQKEELVVHSWDILFIRSDGNYITIGYLKNGRPVQLLLRNTMKYAIELLAAYSFLYQCHRSWIVNLNRISRVSGNSQGLRIVLEGCNEDVPVARKNTQEFRERIAGDAE